MIKVSHGRCLLQHWLDKRDLSQTDFARKTGIDVRMVSHYCNNKRTMTIDALYAASVILEVRMDQIYEFKFGAE
ncbi:helix-turn-helix domain-containing protein [Paenibacillus wenxiniae]